jgi:bacillithiol biosynthesis cysteine-adding enzyme BshC
MLVRMLESLQRARRRRLDPSLVAALERQADDWGGLRPAQRRSLEALVAGAGAVVVGQQVGLLLGPLYTLHKAAAAVATARALTAAHGLRCVPVFWLATEDHDLDEVRQAALPTVDGTLRLTVPDDGRDRVAVRYRTIPAAVADVHDALRRHLGRLPAGDEVVAWAERHWQPGRPWHVAFAGALSELLGDEGLLLLDPRDPALAALSAPLLRAALDRAEEVAAGLSEHTAALVAAGRPAQVHLRPGAPLVFFHPDGPAGPRFRLEPDGPDAWALVGADARLPRAAVRAAAERDPLALGTSALLRPVVQDALLPTALFLGGPAELAYLAQLAPVYRALGVTQPPAAPRASLRLIDAKARALLAELDLAPADLDEPRERLLERLALRRGAALPAPADLRAGLQAAASALLDGAEERVAGLRPVLEPALGRTRGTVTHALDRLADAYARALAQHDEVAAGRLDRLRALLRPDGAPQERVHALVGPAARVGLRALVARVLEACVPLDGATRDVALWT